MTALPSGTVTFLFTDIEGSTRLAQQHPAAWPGAKARHHTILRSAIESHGGYVFQVIGDAFCAAFHTASDALAAALEAQRALVGATTDAQRTNGQSVGATLAVAPDGQGLPLPIRVRMGIHTGSATARPDGDYEGYMALVRVQRIMSGAYGGQVLMSQDAAELVGRDLPAGVGLRDLGTHRLKDLAAPEHLFQVVAQGLPADFPPLKTADHPNNLPMQLTSFIGREAEVAEVRRLLGGTRLLTLSGAGGVGKTRLALQAATEELASFGDGVWFVELAPLADPALVPQATASALGLQEQAGRPWINSLSDYLRAKHLLLVLDNCEHLIEACARLADQLLRGCPKLNILASSREALGIAGETAYRVPSLSLPDPRQFVEAWLSGPLDHAPDHAGQPAGFPLQSLMQYEAVRLFIERAIAVQPSFALTNQNAPAVAQICRRLDGIPLAIELAAARIKSLSPEQIAARLDDRFRLLTGGSRTAMPRQQTLRAAVDWSHSLLTEPERVLLRRLAVFAGGWTLEAAETVCSSQKSDISSQTETSTPSTNLATDDRLLKSDDVLDQLAHLVDKSLVVAEERTGSARYRMLETIRQYAREKSLESGEAERIRDQHLAFFLTVAEAAEPKLYGAEPAKWLQRLDTEHDNLRAAIDWATERGKVELGLRLVVALSWYWFMRVYYTEARARIGALIARSTTVAKTPQIRLAVAKALNRAADFAQDLGDVEKARSFSEESLSMASEDENKEEIAHAFYNLARLALAEGHHPEAAALYDQSIALYREAKDSRGLGGSLQGLAVALTRQGNLEQAVSLYEEVIVLRREMNDKTLLAFALDQLGRVMQLAGNFERAAVLHKESLLLRIRVDNRRGIAFSLLSFAGLAAQQKAERAVQLYGAGEALLEALHAQEEFRDPVVHVQDVATLHAQLDEAAFSTAWNEGRAMTMEQATAYALERTDV
ncbi:MAG: tetratricopeptide repeat protein [Chloroflexi bacterium]|nr:tetratricopeptide repeat protein [Chloroflexota bacterium]